MAKFLFVAVLALAALAVQAREAVPNDPDPALQARVERLTKTLRCLVCQNESIAESNAGLAIDLKNEVRQMMADGKSDKEIVDFLVHRYGDFVLLEPPVKSKTWLLWFGPLVILLVGGAALMRKISRPGEPTPDAASDEGAHQRAQELLETIRKEETA